MYKTATKSSNLLAAAAASLALMSSAAAVAGPGKPGINDILEGGNIAEIALAANGALDEFNLLLEAVLCFGPLENNPVVDLLSSPDKITLFAPTDAAFLNLVGRWNEAYPHDDPITGPCDLAPEPLLSVLLYHVVDGRRFSNSVFNGNNAKSIETLLGAEIVSFVDSEVPMLHDVDGQTISIVLSVPLDPEGELKTYDINASNGVIHVIDTVLLPIELPEPADD